jgi:hypothetical protein
VQRFLAMRRRAGTHRSGAWDPGSASAPRRKRRAAQHPGHEIALSPEQLVNRRSGRQQHRPAGAATSAAADVGGDLGKLRRQRVGLAKFDVVRNDAGTIDFLLARLLGFEKLSCMPASQGPAAFGLVTTRLPSTR